MTARGPSYGSKVPSRWRGPINCSVAHLEPLPVTRAGSASKLREVQPLHALYGFGHTLPTSTDAGVKETPDPDPLTGSGRESCGHCSVLGAFVLTVDCGIGDRRRVMGLPANPSPIRLYKTVGSRRGIHTPSQGVSMAPRPLAPTTRGILEKAPPAYWFVRPTA